MKISVKKLKNIGCSANVVSDNYEAKEGEFLINFIDKPDCDPLFWDIVGGEIVVISGMEEARIEGLRDENYKNADKYFNSQVDNRYFTLLNRADVIANNGAKFQAVSAWVDAFWLDYFSRKSDTENVDFDYSNNNNVPHSFSELRAELGA